MACLPRFGRKKTGSFSWFLGKRFELGHVGTFIDDCRQGLWNADLRTPPGPDGSNGSKTITAVVLWRHFLPSILGFQVEFCGKSDLVKDLRSMFYEI